MEICRSKIFRRGGRWGERGDFCLNANMLCFESASNRVEFHVQEIDRLIHIPAR